MNNNVVYSKKVLEDLYFQGYAMKRMSEKLNCSVGKIYNLFCKYNIKRKSQKDYAREGRFVLSKEKIEMLKNVHKGKVLSDETKKKISNSHKGKFKYHSEFGGHKKTHKNGYVMVYIPEHPYATKDGYIFEHILVYEKFNNVYVDRSKFVIHHINGNKKDNQIKNLMLMTKSEHASYHSKKRQEERRNNYVNQ